MIQLMQSNSTTEADGDQADCRFSFFVPGVPAPKGSMRIVPVANKGGHVRVRIIPDRRSTQWESAIKLAAAEAWDFHGPWDGPVFLHIEFVFPRPKCHFKKRRKTLMVLRDDAPRWVSKRPDLDKLLRCVLDGLTGVVIQDDCQVVGLSAVKRYADGRQKVGINVLAKLLNP